MELTVQWGDPPSQTFLFPMLACPAVMREEGALLNPDPSHLRDSGLGWKKTETHLLRLSHLAGPVVPCLGFPVGQALAWRKPPLETMDFTQPLPDSWAHVTISVLATVTLEWPGLGPRPQWTAGGEHAQRRMEWTSSTLSLDKCLPSTYCVPGPILVAGNQPGPRSGFSPSRS